MLTFEVSKQTNITIPRGWLQQIATAFIKERKLKGSWYFSLAFVDDKTIKRLNNSYRGKNMVTDVLSFTEDFKNFVDLPVDRKYLGEIVISASQARGQAKDIKCSLKNEVARLLIHGLSHLSGYDHEGTSKEEADKMLKFEKKVLKKLRIWGLFKFEEEA
ncbi:MAG: rRNA maturation RNase YbeY [Candidatus Komeilibacteria bacterium]